MSSADICFLQIANQEWRVISGICEFRFFASASKIRSGDAGSEAAMMMFRGIVKTPFYDACDRSIAVIVDERRFELRKSRLEFRRRLTFY